MVRRVMLTTILGLAGAAMAMGQSAPVQQAALWERSKDAPASRQTHAVKATDPKPAAAQTTKAGDGNVDEALRWERAKDRAAKQQAQKDAGAQTNAVTAKSKKK